MRCILHSPRGHANGPSGYRFFSKVHARFVLALALILIFRALVIGNSPPSEGGAPRALIEATDYDASKGGRPGHAHDGDAQGGARDNDKPTDPVACGDTTHTTAGGAHRRGSLPTNKLKDCVSKPKGAPGGPLRTPLRIGAT